MFGHVRYDVEQASLQRREKEKKKQTENKKIKKTN
jgi:hypothetical protein